MCWVTKAILIHKLILNLEISMWNIAHLNLDALFLRNNSKRLMISRTRWSAELRACDERSISSLKIKHSYQERTWAWKRDLREWRISVTALRQSFLKAKRLLKNTWRESCKHQMISEESLKETMRKNWLTWGIVTLGNLNPLNLTWSISTREEWSTCATEARSLREETSSLSKKCVIKASVTTKFLLNLDSFKSSVMRR